MGGFGEVKVVCLVVIAVVAVAATAPHAEAAISCGQVMSSVSPCLPYLRGSGVVAAPCCDGVRNLNKAAATTADRQAVCGCVKSLAPSIGAKTDLINSLLQNVASPFPTATPHPWTAPRFSDGTSATETLHLYIR